MNDTKGKIAIVSELNNAKFDYAILIVDSLIKSADDINRIMMEAVDAGVESGRTIGVLEAYNVLVVAGHSTAATLLLELIEDEAATRKTIADA